MPERVFLAAVDGLDWAVLRKAVQGGRCPNLGQMLENGAWAELPVRNVTPGLPGAEGGMLSPVLWTTVATGQYYFQHGVYGFSHPILCPEHAPLFETGHVQSPRIWDVLTLRELPSLVVGYYVTHPAYQICGSMVGDMFGETESPAVAWPPEMADEIACLLGSTDYRAYVQDWSSVGSEAAARVGGTARDPRVLERVTEILRTFTRLDERQINSLYEDPTRQAERHLVEFRLVYPVIRDERCHRALFHLMAKQDWRFATVYYRLLDFASHGFWPEAGARSALIDGAYGEVLDRAYDWMDARLGEIVRQLGPDDRLIVVSDHGFQASSRSGERAESNDISTVIRGEHAEPAVLLVANGPRRGKLEDVTLLDIAPTILDFFGLPQADSLDGGVVTGMLTQNVPNPQRVSQYEYTIPSTSGGITEAEHQAVLRRLAALGYIE